MGLKFIGSDRGSQAGKFGDFNTTVFCKQLSENSSKSVEEILKNSKNTKKHVFDMPTAFLKKFIFEIKTD